jgi:CelD/BcsL family acetyltransferase involved in cellulose biosynthesis
MERLHTRYWNAKGEPGAFGSEFQRAFHRTIVERGITSGAVVLLAALRGEQAIGYFYYYCHRDWAHYYQSGIDYEQLEGSESPGLAAHALAIEYFRAAGYRIYDFMTGDLQYKRTLATHDMPLHWMVLQQNTPKMRLEVWLLQQAKRARAHWWRTRDAWQQRQAAARAPLAAEAQPSEAKANETKTNEASPG